MTIRYEFQCRLEPRRPLGDLNRGFAAEVHDPVWFLGRQWQMGEHQGENAASPIRVDVVARQTPIEPQAGDPPDDPRFNPAVTPPEAIIEAESDDWWTIGRRVRIGLAAAGAVDALPLTDTQRASLRMADPPPAYEPFVGSYDGLALFNARTSTVAGLDKHFFAEVPLNVPTDRWDPVELVYSAAFPCAGADLRVPRHDGGDVDWWSVEASRDLPPPPPLPPPALRLLPTRFRYPGSPLPRWWQIEDADVDIGGFPPDRSHFATMLLIDLILAHSNDWFTFPVPVRTGSAVTLDRVTVTDVFGQPRDLQVPSEIPAPPGQEFQTKWSLFQVTGLGPRSLVIWPTAATPLTGPAVEEVVLGVDEDANLLWAVEERANLRQLRALPAADGTFTPILPPTVSGPPQPGYTYQPSTGVVPRWHPYVIQGVTGPGDPPDSGRRRFVQARLADLSVRPPILNAEPIARLLADPQAKAGQPVHQIEPSTVPTMGLRLERRSMLARRTDGLPVLWTQRRRRPLLSPPVNGLRFDALTEAPRA